MTQKVIKYPKIFKFRETIRRVIDQSQYIGKDENNEAIFDREIKLPTLRFKGLVKLHGANSAINYNNVNGFWIQTRREIITKDNDFNGLYTFMYSRKDILIDYIKSLSNKFDINLDEYTITIYGEYAGKGIQGKVAISELEKSFYIFGAKVSNLNDDEFTSYWIDTLKFDAKRFNVYNLENFKTYEIDIDFNDPKSVQDKLIEITDSVELECPVAKELGVSGVGEGVVWSTKYKDRIVRFKVNGKKHSVTKKKTKSIVDVEKLEDILDFVSYSLTENRFEHALDEVFKGSLNINKLGEFIKYIVTDIIEEEEDTIKENDLDLKLVRRELSNEVRRMFFKEYNVV